MSDLHLDAWGQVRNAFRDFFTLHLTEADALILAGDCFPMFDENCLEYARRCLEDLANHYKHGVFYVLGNHEYYGRSIEELDAKLSRPGWGEDAGFHLMRTHNLASCCGRAVWGDTMWQPWEEEAPRIGDHVYVKDFYPKAQDKFHAFRRGLARGWGTDADIIVTHHAPSNRSILPQWQGHRANRWFATPEIEPYLLQSAPKLWVHGHMHNRLDYTLGSTRVVCNPRGYPGEPPTGFDPEFIVEL